MKIILDMMMMMMMMMILYKCNKNLIYYIYCLSVIILGAIFIVINS